MYIITSPQTEYKVLFEAVLEPSNTITDELNKGKNNNEGEINSISGKKNTLLVGEPYHENYVMKLIEEGLEIPLEIKNEINNYDYHFLRLSCSFRPDSGCKFTWARFGVKLKAVSRETGKTMNVKPKVIDIFPDEVLLKTKCRRDTNLNSKYKFKLHIVEPEFESRSSSQEEFFTYEPRVYAYGINTDSMSWDFLATSEEGIWGDKKDLFLLVKVTKDSILKGKFNLSAEVQVGKLRNIPLKKREDDIVNIEYILSK